MKSILSSALIALSLSRRSCSSSFVAKSIPATTVRVEKAFLNTGGLLITKNGNQQNGHISKITKLQMSSSSPPEVTSVGKEQMNKLIQAVEDSSSEYVIIDVRNVDEINATGKLSPVVETLPLPYIAQYGVFNMDAEEFEENFGFTKPELDQTLVLTCKAGIRSMHAAQFAAQAGYTNIINYGGGADEWFR